MAIGCYLLFYQTVYNKLMGQVNLTEKKDFLLNLMPQAGKMLRHYFLSEKLASKAKDRLDIVTEADLAMDDFLKRELGQRYPDIPILTEETAPSDLSSFKREKLLWVIDPLDGTANFSKKIDHFAISIGLTSYSQPIIGVVYNPMTADCYWTTDDADGAFCNDKRISISTTTRLSNAVIGTDTSHNLKTLTQTAGVISKLINEARQVLIMGSSAFDLCLVACGKLDAYHHVYCMPWDLAAASLIVQKAGGVVTDINGREWNVFIHGILAANPVLHRKILIRLRGNPMGY